MDAAGLRPLGVGEILDVAINVYRSRFGVLVKVVAVIVGPVLLLGALVQVSVTPASLTTAGGETPKLTAGDLSALLAGLLIVTLLSFVAGQIATGACFKVVSGAYLGEQLDWRESLRFAAARLRSLIWLAVLFGFLVVLGMLACLLPGVYFSVAWAVAIPVLLFEGAPGRAALKRSRALVEGRWWPSAGVLVVAFFLTAIVGAAFGGILGAAVASVDNDVVSALGRALGNVAASVLTTPFLAAVTTVLYFDLRVRKEGLDLELMARHVGIDPPRGDPGTILPLPPPQRPSGGLPPPSSGGGGQEPPFWPPPPGWRPDA